MNIFSFRSGVSPTQNSKNSIFVGSMQLKNNMELKSSVEKMQRMQKTASQVDFYEQQKANLQNMTCDNVESIAEKLNMFHRYEDKITAAKMSYNHEQMWHTMDEAREQGEKIAEKVEEMEPKTPEERLEEMAEEALGIEEEKSSLAETLEESMEENLESLKEGLDSLENLEGLEEGLENLESLEEGLEVSEVLEMQEGATLTKQTTKAYIESNIAEKMVSNPAYKLTKSTEEMKWYTSVDIKI